MAQPAHSSRKEKIFKKKVTNPNGTLTRSSPAQIIIYIYFFCEKERYIKTYRLTQS